MITTPLRILLIDSSTTDAELISRHIKKIVENPEIEVVDNYDECNTKLYSFVPDVVISDYNLPDCTGIEILKLTQSVDNSIPFIFLTGALDDEELAANTILSGATGFILKKHMKVLNEKLKPLLKKVAFDMGSRDDVRERIRRNKIAINQIYQYLDNVKTENKEHQENLKVLKRSIDRKNLNEDVE